MVSALLMMDLETKQNKSQAEQLIQEYLQKLLVEATPDRMHTVKIPENKNDRLKVETAAR